MGKILCFIIIIIFFIFFLNYYHNTVCNQDLDSYWVSVSFRTGCHIIQKEVEGEQKAWWFVKFY